LKLSSNQLDFASQNPKEMAKALKAKGFMRGGFNKVTKEVCLSYAKGNITFKDASYLLDIRLSDEFANNDKNAKKRLVCQSVLVDFKDFIKEEGLQCLKSYSLMNIDMGNNHSIGGQSCAIFQNAEGESCGVILTDHDYNPASTLRIPIEQYWIAKHMKMNDSTLVKIYVYNMEGKSYQLIQYPAERIEIAFKQSKTVIEQVDIEFKKIA
jgi:hypothetical protein